MTNLLHKCRYGYADILHLGMNWASKVIINTNQVLPSYFFAGNLWTLLLKILMGNNKRLLKEKLHTAHVVQSELVNVGAQID